MGKKIDRTGEERVNSFGSKMVISKYNGALDMDVYFPEYNWTAKNQQYNNFKTGNIKCPYEKRVFGVGYMGKVNIRCLNMVKIKKNILYGMVC